MHNKEEAALAGAAYKNNSRRKSYQKHSYQTIIKKDFVMLSRAALHTLPQLLTALNISFRMEGHEIVMLNPRRSDSHFGSFRINRTTGRWSDFAMGDVCGGDAVSLFAYLLNVRQGDAAQWIQRTLGGNV